MRFFRQMRCPRIVLGLFFLSMVSYDLSSSEIGWADQEKTPKVENLISQDYGKLILDDSWHILSSPARWNGEDWFKAGLVTGSVIAVGALADRSIEKAIQRNRTRRNDNFSKAIQPFGAEYTFAVLGAFEVGGLVFKDENARATAQDGLASSIIAAGLLTPSLKYATGRKRPSQDTSSHRFTPFGGDDSFPSGHTTQAFAVASVIAEHYDSHLIKIGAYGTATLVGFARMERKAHWASDVLAAAFIGTFVGREIVHFNHDKRYEISMIASGDTVGAQVTHTF